MARKRKPKTDDVPPPPEVAAPSPLLQTRSRAVGKLVFALLAVAGLVGGVAWIGERAGVMLVGRSRYEVRTADILCEAPPGSERSPFLTEVRYLAGLPDSVSVVDPELPQRLRTSFTKHPWVAEVMGITVSPDRRIRVELRFRVPVLSIPVGAGAEWRAVDGSGVLLPATTPTSELTQFVGTLPAPPCSAGEPWPDPDVKFAAELCKQYSLARIEKTAKGWRLTQRDGKVLIVAL